MCIYMCVIWLVVGYYGISIFVGYLTPNRFYTILFQTI